MGAHVSHVAGLDGSASPQPDPDPEAPRDNPHDTHAWVLFDRWAECDTCGARDHWAGAEAPCPGVPESERAVTLDAALDRLCADLEAFEAWWKAKGLEASRPSQAEWVAEFTEWELSKGRKRT